jgi:hypothetical protein
MLLLFLQPLVEVVLLAPLLTNLMDQDLDPILLVVDKVVGLLEAAVEVAQDIPLETQL